MAFNVNIQGQNIEFEEFYSPGSLGWVQASQACQAAGYRQLTMPEQVEARITAPNNSPLWQKWNDTTSMRITGRTHSSNYSRNGGSPIDAFYHGPLQISLEYIQAQIQRNQLRAGGLPISWEQFDAMLQQCAPENIVNHDVLMSSVSGKVPLTAALTHPQTVLFIGSRERAERYLSRFAQVYNTGEIGIWYYDDLNDRSPTMRPLCLGDGCSDGLDANRYFSSNGRFFGVRASQNFFPVEISQGNSQQNPNTRLISQQHSQLSLEDRTLLEAARQASLTPAIIQAIREGKPFNLGNHNYYAVQAEKPNAEPDSKDKRFRLIELD